MNLELIGALTELEKERGISKDILLEAIEVAMVSAYKRNYGSNSSMSVRVDLNEQTGEINVFSRKVVTEQVNDDITEISVNDAQELDPNFQVGDIVEQEVTPRDFGRIAAQTAKQVVIQRIREAERTMVFTEYANRAGDVVTGIIHRLDHKNVLVDLGKVEAVLPTSEQIGSEEYTPNSRFKFYINEVKQSSKGPQIFLSRTHPGLLKNLFELEVPEIQSGVLEIKAVAREAGYRSKIAVFSRDPDVDPVGSCVGAKGMRVQAVVSQLNGEKIDIVQWVPDTSTFIANALSPAKTIYIKLDEKTKTARTVVPDDQLSLAIGKEGQNARLAARLTGHKIDIKSEMQAKTDPLFQLKVEPEIEETVTPAPASAGLENEKLGQELIVKEQQENVAPPTEKELADIQIEELAKLSKVKHRKSWEERFGSKPVKESGNQDASKEKRKKKDQQEKVIKDFSMLDLDDFRFDDKK